MKTKTIPDIVIGRLPVYLRSLRRMQQSGRQITSSQELGERLGISAAQIRKDLSQFGEFGKQGTGYNIGYLADELEAILKLDRVWDVAIVGAGGVGQALAKYDGFHTVNDWICHILIHSVSRPSPELHTLSCMENYRCINGSRCCGVQRNVLASFLLGKYMLYLCITPGLRPAAYRLANSNEHGQEYVC